MSKEREREREREKREREREQTVGPEIESRLKVDNLKTRISLVQSFSCLGIQVYEKRAFMSLLPKLKHTNLFLFSRELKKNLGTDELIESYKIVQPVFQCGL